MLGQGIITIISTVIGGLLVLIANYLNQRLVSSTEKEKALREKIEEAYMDFMQVNTYFSVALMRAFIHENAGIYITNVPSKYTLEYTEEIGCPIEKLQMIVRLYTKIRLRRYIALVEIIRGIDFGIRNNFGAKDMDMMYNDFIEHYIKEFSIKKHISSKEDFLNQLVLDFNKTYNEIENSFAHIFNEFK